ncbi:M1 family metallopeptidase [Nocardioides allogilvus]|uniref:M1 family metallopeptidase n=1 Tax=Nocardioides allogilvus TaxID=2072017 RepID=UPI0018E558C0|nr:M1 family metallopeptidase [Nocardioides allogilvus]
MGLAALVLLAGCSSPPDAAPDVAPPAPSSESATAVAVTTPEVAERVEPDLELAESTPVEDSVYPAVGGPDVDALLYDLDLAWQPDARTLTGTATITFRAARDARRFTLDLAAPLGVESVTLDGSEAAYAHRGKDLTVKERLVRDGRHELVIAYSGQPGPVAAPTTRRDFSTLGFTVTDRGEVWTMQEPYGAYSWYPVNDQPADKALYDISVTVPDPWTGVANGRLVADVAEDGLRTTEFQLDEPASSYLITLAIGDYAHSSGSSESGVRLDYWYPRGQPLVLDDMTAAHEAIDWIEARLGPYPFSSAGIVATDSQSAMETQTMVTIGDNDYVRSAPVLVHELVHQWYGDQVSPADWRDVWLNEGMTMLLQGLWEADHDGDRINTTIGRWRDLDQDLRDDYGPPGAYDPAQFGGSNVYYSPALMWNELRLELGDDEFFRIARSWLAAHDNTSVTRDDLYAHWEQETGRELSAFFDAWILGRTTPPPGV